MLISLVMDGKYQCNRNRTNLGSSRDGRGHKKAEVDFIVRQKEAAGSTRGFSGRDWTLQAPSDATVGTVEILVLRCSKEPANASFNVPLRTATATRHQKTDGFPGVGKPYDLNSSPFGFDGPFDQPSENPASSAAPGMSKNEEFCEDFLAFVCLHLDDWDDDEIRRRWAAMKQCQSTSQAVETSAEKDPYFHKAVDSLEYVDSIEKPYATFIFRYGKASEF